MKVLCPTCGKPIPAEDLNLDHLLAKCRSCNIVFDFASQVQVAVLPEAKLKRDRGELPLPPQIKVEKGKEGLVITREWDRRIASFFLLFAGLWIGIVLVVAIPVLTIVGKAVARTGGWGVGHLSLLMTPFFLIGLGMLWAGLGLRLNRTTIRVGGGRLSVTNGPVPWSGNRSLDSSTLKDLISTEYVAYLKNRMPQYRFMVQGLLKDGRKVKLIRGIEDSAQALCLEGLLETHLGIAVRPVEGEPRGG